MSCVIEDKSEWVSKNGHSFIETDAMFSDIACGFCWIPLESHIYILLYYDFAPALYRGIGIIPDFAEFEVRLPPKSK